MTFWETIIANCINRYSVNHFWADACGIQYEFIVVNGQNYDFCISQGSAATVLRWDGQNYSIYANAACQKLLKSANVSRSYSKNKSGFLFWNTVYIITSFAFYYVRQHICHSTYMPWQFRLSVRLSHGWISQKRLKLGSRNFHHTVAPSL